MMTADKKTRCQCGKKYLTPYDPLCPRCGALNPRGRDLKMMRTPEDWPVWPRLPLKRRQGGGQPPELGFLVAIAEWRTRVFFDDMFAPITDDTRCKDYPDLEAIVADGWIVD
jgi:hypothetical protein